MKTRPRQLTFLTVLLLAVSIGMPLQIMVLYGLMPWELTAIFSKLTPLNWMIFISAPFVAMLIYKASLAGVAALFLFCALVVYNNFFVASVGMHYSGMQIGIATGAFMLLVGASLTQEICQLFLDSKMRWWLTAARYRAAVPIHIEVLGENKKEIRTKTFDLSENGAFLPIEDLPVGTHCQISLKSKGISLIQCRAEVVRKTDSLGRYPSGVGIQFLNLNWWERQKLNAFLRQLTLRHSS